MFLAPPEFGGPFWGAGNRQGATLTVLPNDFVKNKVTFSATCPSVLTVGRKLTVSPQTLQRLLCPVCPMKWLTVKLWLCRV